MKIPPLDFGVTGLFALDFQIDSEFSADIYVVRFTWDHSGSTFAKLASFEVTAGGHASGAYVELYRFRKSHADYVVGVTDADVLEWRKNPRLGP